MGCIEGMPPSWKLCTGRPKHLRNEECFEMRCGCLNHYLKVSSLFIYLYSNIKMYTMYPVYIVLIRVSEAF